MQILLVHFRNERGSLPTAGAFEEELLDDGYLNMFKILMELKKVGFDGCLNPDDVSILAGDVADKDKKWTNSNIGCNAPNLTWALLIPLGILRR